MVAAVAAAAVVVRNVRLFIVTSLEVRRNLINADQDFELPTGFVSNSGTVVRMLGTVARTEFAESRPTLVADDTFATLAHARASCSARRRSASNHAGDIEI
jgi:hypothetical protein